MSVEINVKIYKNSGKRGWIGTADCVDSLTNATIFSFAHVFDEFGDILPVAIEKMVKEAIDKLTIETKSFKLNIRVQEITFDYGDGDQESVRFDC